MHRSYNDIREKLGEPKWFDGNAAPRYCEFHPDRCGVYDDYVALVEIACQECGARFLVAVENYKYNIWTTRKITLPTAEGVGWFHYGDPPRHSDSCAAGDTMNVETLRIVEFWERLDSRKGWQRNAAYEFDYEAVLL